MFTVQKFYTSHDIVIGDGFNVDLSKADSQDQRFRYIESFVRDCKSRKENPQKLTQLSSRSHPRHLVGKRTAQKDTIIDITSDSQVNSYVHAMKILY